MNNAPIFKLWDPDRKSLSPPMKIYDMIEAYTNSVLAGTATLEDVMGAFGKCRQLQWTGCVDKSGTKIFVGDIVQRAGNHSVIEFSGGMFGMKPLGLYRNWGNRPFSRTRLFPIAVGVEVIGNIYENPELLKGGTHEDI